ncbi:ABC transporter substrate-binding protein [Thermomonospora cellulosilytica]|uniref:ABC-type branched-subunit amino acid transport system substrate-binding protein n=1 Tax=Thermomonospora cellulosilytica TaxID=1411118 RepID=A0A7W3N0R7_9ACTN|nr:ABC transporter substrate-binding protein [Thermomonospora cellulosilytica]MBA9005418.1 ABC-type branched-subunit amino acid transport system substrate-binding protein [Thermomonospora cellulosilytica]
MRLQRTLVALTAVALLTAACGRSGSGVEEETGAGGAAGPAATGDFGDLRDICGPGDPKSSPAQGVTAEQIEVGVFTDMGFSKKSEFVDAAKVFTTWCNEAGGIKGRKLVANTRDSKLLEVRQRMIESCREDFALVGGGAALDAMGVKERLSCLLPAFPAQTSQVGNTGSELQFETVAGGPSYSPYGGFYTWLLKEAYPGSAENVGVISGDSPVTKVLELQTKQALTAAGGTVGYSELYPAQGVSDWTPYAQAIKSKGVKGLVFLGDFRSLAKLEQVLTNIDYKLDWIDANSNSYGPEFLQLAGPAVAGQNNLLDLGGVHPLEKADANPATRQVVELFKKHAPGKPVTLQVVRAFVAWTLFAKAASSCGDDLTRRCVVEAAAKETAWTGGGLQAPVDLSDSDAPAKCFNVEQATPDGWKPADFKPDTGAYRCNAPAIKFTDPGGKPLTLADVGKSMSDVK